MPLDDLSKGKSRTGSLLVLAGCSHLSVALRTRIGNLLEGSPDRDHAARYLEELEARYPGWLTQFASQRGTLQRLIIVFGHSRFLSEDVLRHPEWVSEITDLYRPFSVQDFTDLLFAFVKPGSLSGERLALFRRKQLLRIVLRDVMNLAALPEITEELSNLSDAILEFTLDGVTEEVAARFGKPVTVLPDGRRVASGFCVIALGKLGGRELNYSSDIDLMYLFGGNGETDGSESITNREFQKRVATRYTEVLSTYTAEGLCYRVDLRLRPEGRYGEICLSLNGAMEYYSKRARDWELQMLIKARVAAGDAAIGNALLDFVQPLIYSTTLDFSAIETMSATRERIGEKLASKRHKPGEFDVKLARGGIRDIEFLVQCLQRLHGGREPWVRHGGTLLALSRLLDKGLLSGSEYSRLANAYQFLRHLEHRLQLEDDQQTHVLPVDEKELERLSRRMPNGFNMRPAESLTGSVLLRQLNEHLENVHTIYNRVVHAQQPLYYAEMRQVERPQLAYESEKPFVTPSSNIIRFLDQSAPKLAERLTQRGMKRGQRAFEHFLERAMEDPACIQALNDNPAAAEYLLQIFEASPYFSEQLIRNPELAEEVVWVADPVNRRVSLENAGQLNDATALRRFFRRELFRIEAASICIPEDVFVSLDRTSSLADFVIANAYRISLEQAIAHAQAHASSEDPFSAPTQDMMVIALGRLGMREFDLASDADLVFVLPDSEAERQKFWTRVAEHLIKTITAYTADGIIFSIDTRLRPNGREGKLVQTESGMKEYFSSKAEAWEGIAYMKARAVAGDLERATVFLTDLQQVDWRQYGQSGRSKQNLYQMRLRLEREQSAANPLKAGPGGYYDADFALMFLRLKGAGLFFKTLNTPERIDIVEKMGHLDRADAEFLRRATTFYRALDHGLRIVTGHAEGSLPGAKSELEMIAELIRRWIPDFPMESSLEIELARMQEQMRQTFERLFA